MKVLGKQAIRLIALVALLGVVFVLGLTLGQIINWETGQNLFLASATADEDGADFTPFWQAWRIIDEKYVDWSNGEEQSVNNQQKVWGAVTGLVNSLEDPYSVFLPPDDKKLFEEEIQGDFGGVGIEIGVRDEFLTVIAPLEGTPAKAAGILPGDRIIQVDETIITKLSVDEVIKLIRGEVGEPVTLHILRGEKNEPRSITLVRGVINVPTIETSVERGVFVIKLYNFGATAEQKFAQAMREFKASGRDKLILDLRGNPGGFLSAAIDVASWFLPAGETVAIEQGHATEDPVIYRSKGYPLIQTQAWEMAILVNQGSASAAEIVAGALAESGKAVLVGEQTFGKGSVQELIPLNKNSAIKLTTAKWLTPGGLSISKNGLTPDHVVEVDEEAATEGEDEVLEAALDLLNS